MDTTVPLAFPETISDVNPIAEAIDPTVMVADVTAATPALARGRGRPKKSRCAQFGQGEEGTHTGGGGVGFKELTWP
jgi:hypothetical protein